MDIFQRHIRDKKVLRCPREDCVEGLVKPDVTFFGESLPQKFVEEFNHVKDADLVFIMGTSLQVAPFNLLVQLVPRSVPIVLINKDKHPTACGGRENLLFLHGDIEKQVAMIAEE